jgi:hypothetical protein
MRGEFLKCGRGAAGQIGQRAAAQKKARLRKARRLLIVPFKTKLLLYNYIIWYDKSFLLIAGNNKML